MRENGEWRGVGNGVGVEREKMDKGEWKKMRAKNGEKMEKEEGSREYGEGRLSLAVCGKWGKKKNGENLGKKMEKEKK